MQKFQKGDIVLAFLPKEQIYWPGKILSIDLMVEIQFYKQQLSQKVPPKKIELYTPYNISRLLNAEVKNLASAIKMADKELAEKQKIQDEGKRKKELTKGKVKIQTPQPQKQTSNFKGNQVFKKQEEEDKGDQDQEAMAQDFSQFLNQMNQTQLINEVNANAVKQIQFLNLQSKQVQTHMKEPKILLIELTEQLMKRLWHIQNRSDALPIEKKLKNIMNSWKVDPNTIFYSQICKIINITIKQQKERFPWITNTYIQTLQRFKKTLKDILDAFQDDYSEIGPSMNTFSVIQAKKCC